ncbi:MAG: HD domain-containing phosphohydrolase [Verrucomicrobiota bacterium]|jgi:response regulator RpfG family c-di-GMP phosphodiesterase
MPQDTPPLSQTAHPILIVDDEEIVLVALRDTLAREGYHVVASPHAIHALTVLKDQQFSVIISDQQMPLISGLEFLTQVREVQPNATRILITAVLSLSTVIDAINKGEIYRFVVKPWLREELLVTVRAAVQRFEVISNNARLQADTQAMNARLADLNKELETQVAQVARQNTQLQQLLAEQDENLRQSVELCVQTMQTFHPTLGNRARRVQALCRSMGQRAELSPAQQQILEISAAIHDIGLIGLPRQLIKRWEDSPQSLNEAESALVRHHPILGQELAGFVHRLQSVGSIIRSHHERFDGGGYPDGLKGAAIPWLSRLLAVAVAYAESQLGAKEAAEVISQGSGSAFDPEAVRLFQRAAPKAVVPGKQREVMLSELAPGMVLAQGIYSENGVLLIPDGQRLTSTYIDKLLNYNRINPISQSLLVYC